MNAGAKVLKQLVKDNSEKNPTYIIALANQLGMDASHLDAIRRGAVVPDQELAERIEYAIGIPRSIWRTEK